MVMNPLSLAFGYTITMFKYSLWFVFYGTLATTVYICLNFVITNFRVPGLFFFFYFFFASQ